LFKPQNRVKKATTFVGLTRCQSRKTASHKSRSTALCALRFKTGHQKQNTKNRFRLVSARLKKAAPKGLGAAQTAKKV